MELVLDTNKRYTFADYLTWIDEKRRELIDGIVKRMSPAPATNHQRASLNVASEIRIRLKKSKCQIFVAPFDVRLLENQSDTTSDKIYTVVQPDICVICDPKKIDERGCLGAPDMIAEIVSPGNAKHDVEVKFALYEKHGVREYWLVFPHEKSISTFILDENGKYQHAGMYAGDSQIPLRISENISIDLAEVFDFET